MTHALVGATLILLILKINAFLKLLPTSMDHE